MLNLLKKYSSKSLAKQEAIAMCSRVRCSDLKSNFSLNLLESLKANKKFVREYLNAKNLQTVIDLDDRVEYFEISKERRKVVSSTAAIIHSEFVDEDNRIIINTDPYTHNEKDEPFCECERFYGQPMAVHCSGVALSENVVVTAAHCLDIRELNDFRVVFGFWYDDDLNINVDHISKVSRLEPIYDHDVAFLVMENKIPSKNTVKKFSQEVGLKNKIYSSGYPGPGRVTRRFAGIPLKVVENGTIKEESEDHHFFTNLDAFNRCSGAPVFNNRNELVGIITQTSGIHFVRHPLCGKYVSCYYPEDEIPGIEIVPLKVFYNQFKSLQL